MDLYETMDFYKKHFPEKDIVFVFDKKCLQKAELLFTDGIANEYHHVQYMKVKAQNEGEEPKYIDISPHRITLTTKEIEKLINE